LLHGRDEKSVGSFYYDRGPRREQFVTRRVERVTKRRLMRSSVLLINRLLFFARAVIDGRA
jgi:hypothetical protein